MGMQWNLLGSVVNGILQLAVMVILARLIAPAEFGVLAVAQVAVAFAGYFSNLGVVPALIRSKELSDREIRTAHGISVLFSMLLALILWVGAPFSLHLMDSPKLPLVIRLMGVNFLLTGLGMVSGALLRKELRFGYLAISQTASYAVGYFLVGIPMALGGAGVWALVAAQLTQAAVRTAMQYAAAPHSLYPVWDVAHIKSILSYGSQHSLSGVLEFFGNALDRVYIGKYFGDAALGVYTRGSSLITMPSNYMGAAITNILFPSFSEAQHDVLRLQRGYLKGLAACSMLMLPFAMAMAPVARPVIGFVLGDRWLGAAPAFVGYGFIAWLGIVATISLTVVDVIGRQRSKLVIHSLALFFMIVALCLVVVSRGGLSWVVCAVLGGYFLRTLLSIVVVNRLLGMGKAILRAFASGLYIGSLLLVTSWLGLRYWSELPVYVWLPLAMASGCILAMSGLLILKMPYVQELMELILESYPVLTKIPGIGRLVGRLMR